jgi:hypothetical protein
MRREGSLLEDFTNRSELSCTNLITWASLYMAASYFLYRASAVSFRMSGHLFPPPLSTLVMAKNDETENNGSIQEATVAGPGIVQVFHLAYQKTPRRYHPILTMTQRSSLLFIGRDEVPS